MEPGWSDGTTALLFEPIELLERLAALTRGTEATSLKCISATVEHCRHVVRPPSALDEPRVDLCGVRATTERRVIAGPSQ